MFNSSPLRNLAGRYPLVGPALWILSLQYLITQLVVAIGWQTPYSILKNTISDLGNTVCGAYDGRQVCSPLHPLMNVSFVVLGMTMLVGAVLIYQEFRKNIGSTIGFTFMILAGLGTILVGLSPENNASDLHFLGAMLPFVIGNIGMVVLGASLKLPRWWRIYSVLSGLMSLAALLLFVTHNYLGIGIGGMERIAAYPQTIWLIVTGIYLSRNH